MITQAYVQQLLQAINNFSSIDVNLKKYLRFMLPVIVGNQRGLCHTNSALLYSFFREQGYNVTWRVGYFETFDGFSSYCKSYSHHLQSNIVWHSWLEVDGEIIDIPIINQNNHTGFPIVVLGEVLDSKLKLGSDKVIREIKGHKEIAQYHHGYPKKFPTKEENMVLPLVFDSLSPSKQLNNKDMPRGWERDFNITVQRQTGCVNLAGWSNSYNEFVCKRNYISRYSYSTSLYSTPLPHVYRVLEYIENTYGSSRINRLVIIAPNVFFIHQCLKSSLCNNVEFVSAREFNSYKMEQKYKSRYDSVAYIVFKEFGVNEEMLYDLEKIGTTRIIVAIHTKPLEKWQTEEIIVLDDKINVE